MLSAFLTVWLILGAYSWAAFPIEVFGVRLTKLRPAELFGASAPRVVAMAQPPGSGQQRHLGGELRIPRRAISTSSTRRPAPSRRVPADGAPQRILMIGDSMVPVLVPRLADYCLENGHELFPVVWYGSTIIYWARDDRLDHLLAEVQPTLVIAVLGSSELTVREVEECEPFVRIIDRKLGRRNLVWIGPPNWREDTGVNALVDGVLGEQRFFRSAGLPLERRADGIHPTELGGAAWVDAFIHWLVAESLHPVRMGRPTRAAPPISIRTLREPTPGRR